MMSDTKRMRKVINWLIYKEIAGSERELSEILGYTKSSFSQIVNGRVPLSDKFVGKLCSLDNNINKVWVLKGEGKMFLNDNPNSENYVSVPKEVWAVLKQQSESLAARDRQVDDMLNMLKEQIEDLKKANALTGGAATSAAVG